MTPIPFTITNWNELAVQGEAGVSGEAYVKSIDLGDVKLRQIKYSPGYEADHFCTKGHIVYCIAGSFEITLSDLSTYLISAGNTFQVSDNLSTHKVISKTGATVFVVDGNFLK